MIHKIVIAISNVLFFVSVLLVIAAIAVAVVCLPAIVIYYVSEYVIGLFGYEHRFGLDIYIGASALLCAAHLLRYTKHLLIKPTLFGS